MVGQLAGTSLADI